MSTSILGIKIYIKREATTRGGARKLGRQECDIPATGDCGETLGRSAEALRGRDEI